MPRTTPPNHPLGDAGPEREHIYQRPVLHPEPRRNMKPFAYVLEIWALHLALQPR
jgi:hypothetical protein